MAALFADLPEALAATVDIAQRCAFRPQVRKPILPRFSLGSAPVDEPAEEAARYVAEETPQDPAEALGLQAEAVDGPESRGGAEHHDEQPNSLDEHGFPPS